MTIGPAPMIMIDLMSVRFGIGLQTADKKRARKSARFAPGGVGPARGLLRPESVEKGRAQSHEVHRDLWLRPRTQAPASGYMVMGLSRRKQTKRRRKKKTETADWARPLATAAV